MLERLELLTERIAGRTRARSTGLGSGVRLKLEVVCRRQFWLNGARQEFGGEDGDRDEREEEQGAVDSSPAHGSLLERRAAQDV